jgi:D-tyrosyl-tRNA(Tyr) deacylase
MEVEGIRTQLGEFGAEMDVELVNRGPFTIWLDTADRGHQA